MHRFRILAAGCLLLAMPFAGSAQQAPQEPQARPLNLEKLNAVVRAQTDIIRLMKERIEALEARVKALESAATPGAPQ